MIDILPGPNLSNHLNLLVSKYISGRHKTNHYNTMPQGLKNGVIPYKKPEASESNSRLVGSYGLPKHVQAELEEEAENATDALTETVNQQTVYAKQNEYQRKQYTAFEEMKNEEGKSYKEIMQMRNEQKKKLEEAANQNSETKADKPAQTETNVPEEPERRKRKRRWDVRNDESDEANSKEATPSEDKKSKSDVSQNHKGEMSITNSIPTIGGIPLTPENLTLLLPEGFVVSNVPEDYVPLNNNLPDYSALPTSVSDNGYMIPADSKAASEFKFVNPAAIHEVPGLRDLQYFKESDMRYFGKLITTKDIPSSDLSPIELKERKLLKVLLKIKNGTPQSRKVAMRQLTDNCRSYGPKLIFDIVLPLMMEKTIEPQERHLLVKIIGRVLFKLDDKIKPFTPRILIAVKPLLIDEDLYTRLEGREIISNLSKAAGLAHMISTLRPDIDHPDDYVRNTVARTFAVVASSLGIHSLLPFLRAVCNSKKSWLARHTGVKIIQQIALMVGSGILPHLYGLVNCMAKNLNDENLNVRTITALSLASLAEASAPYGIESFEGILEPLWQGIKKLRGKSLAAFLRALGFIIPLMEEEYSNFYTKEVFTVLIREFSSPDEEMKKTCLQVIQQCCATDSLDKKFLLEKVMTPFFGNFWSIRIASDKRLSNMCIDASVAISTRAGCSQVIEKLVTPMKHESEPFRRMAIETANRTIVKLGSYDLSDRTVDRVIDGLEYSLQHQSVADEIFVTSFGNIMQSLGIRTQKRLALMISAILFRLENKSAEIRQQAAELIVQLAPVLKICGEEKILIKLGTVLYESLGEVYPDVLGSILSALRAVIQSLGVVAVNPPISQILATLTPILRNRHERVQGTTIALIGDIADKGKEFINHREWMRISFELLEMLKAQKKSIRKSANTTFGLIAKAIGPSDVLVTLLNNLRVQERQLRVCTAVAIGIVAEICSPYTVLPAMMNEYRTPDKNVQNGILKAMSFMFEYIGDMGTDYIYAVTPLLQDALTDRDLIHRQTAATVIRHMALGSIGSGYEDAFNNFLNLLWPNIFETSPHVITRIMDGIEGCRNVLGCGILMDYLVLGLFHPARKVRAAYWSVFNSMYIQSCDSIVPYYPRLEEVGPELSMENSYAASKKEDLGVTELDMWI